MSEELQLNAHEARVLGVLIEKDFTTPDQYPLSLNALTIGCNQKSNRNPQVDYTEAEIVVTIQGLVMKGLAGRVIPAGSRVEKWRHTADARLELSQARLAIMAELLLRGPQSPGELRTRASRMEPIKTLDALLDHLLELIQRGLARRLPPAPGSRAERYTQLLSAEQGGAEASAEPAPAATPAEPDRVARLEQQIARLDRQLRFLADEMGATLPEA